ncbi:MAG: hypothetical protein LIR50_10915 [Bacillota bacterium]|nr:hypothetical protein [Bacillota bacterium]
MYFRDFSFDNLTTDNQRRFIEALSKKLEYMDPPLIAFEEVKITDVSDKDGKYLKVIIPHKLKKEFNLWIAVYDKEVIVFFSEAHEHFELYGENDEWIIDAVYFVSHILSGKVEIHTFYKGNKVIKVRTYFIDNPREKELLSSCGHLTLMLLNPFARAREETERVSFFPNNVNEFL